MKRIYQIEVEDNESAILTEIDPRDGKRVEMLEAGWLDCIWELERELGKEFSEQVPY